MDTVASPPETRARSRSKTPFQQTSEEDQKRKKSPIRKSPNLQAITEDNEAATPKVTQTRQSSQKQSNETANKSIKKSSGQTVTSQTIVQTSTTTVTTKKSAGSANNSDNKLNVSSKEQKEAENRRTREIKQNEITEKIVKKTVTSTPKKQANQSVTFKLNSSHENLNLNEHLAYKEYIEAGEYWNKYPKTDYTYSEISPHRRELAPGVVAMPNMSRKSLDRHVERVNTMIMNNPGQESYIRQRYQWNPNVAARNAANKSFSFFSKNLLNYDSQDEVDLSEFNRKRTVLKEFFLKRVVTTIWVWITTVFSRGISVFKREKTVTREQFTNLNQQNTAKVGLFRRVSLLFKESVLSIFQRIYMILASILFLDTWLLHRRSDAAVEQVGQGDVSVTEVEAMPKSKKRFLWTIGLLLPILLIAGWYSFCASGRTSIIDELSVAETVTFLRDQFQGKLSILASTTSGLIASLPTLGKNKEEESLYKAEPLTATFDEDAIRRDLRAFVMNLMNEQKQDIIKTTNNYYMQFGAESETKMRQMIEAILAEKAAEFQKRSLTSEEISNILNLLVEKLRAENYPGFKLTEENLRLIFLDMRQRFVNDNQIFLEKILNDPQFNIHIANQMDTSHLDSKIEELIVSFNKLKNEHINLGAEFDNLKNTVNQDEKLELLKQHLMLLVDEMIKGRVKEVVETMVVKEHGHFTENKPEDLNVLKMIDSALKVYNADKTGLADYALESAGGQVLSTRCTENYQTKSAQILVFGIPLWYPSNTPRTAIQPNVQPGNCWAFQGFPGFLVLQLNMEIYVSSFTLEHIPKSLSNGQIDSAPKVFSVWGLKEENDYEPVNFGYYAYSDDDLASSYQHFPVQNTNIDRKFQIVELRIESNHGHPNYTCLYRFRVHGSPIRNSQL